MTVHWCSAQHVSGQNVRMSVCPDQNPTDSSELHVSGEDVSGWKDTCNFVNVMCCV